MGKFAIEKFKKLVSLGNNPSRRTLKNFVEIVRQMEKIDEKAPTLDIISGIVHMGFYYKEGFLQDGSRRTSDIEDLSSITFLDYPKKDPNKLIQDQIKLNDDLKQALRDVASSLRQWKKIKHNGVWVNLGHAMAGLDCELRSGLFKGLLYTYGGDILKRSRDIFLINPPKGEEPGSLTPDDWEGDSLSGDFLKHYHYLKSIEKKPRLSDILEKDMKGSGVKLPAGVDLDAGAPPLEPDAGMPETSGLFHHESSIKPSLSDRIRILEEFNEQPSVSSQTRMASTIPELPDFDEQSHFNWQDRQKSTVSGPSERIKILEEFEDQPSISPQIHLVSTTPELPDLDEEPQFDWQARQASTLPEPPDFVEEPQFDWQERRASTMPELPDFDEHPQFDWQDRQASTIPIQPQKTFDDFDRPFEPPWQQHQGSLAKTLADFERPYEPPWQQQPFQQPGPPQWMEPPQVDWRPQQSFSSQPQWMSHGFG